MDVEFTNRCVPKSLLEWVATIVILPKDNVVIWFCSLYNRPNNYLTGIINSVLKGFNDSQGSNSKVATRWIVVKCNKQKGSTECEYYIIGNEENEGNSHYVDKILFES
ncbi:hypothetical protein GmHk_10G028614 [Glycine max]|nr:hypothetical protein GmHk_10G028614 [Glycine max]